ncbi:MAG: hypothetical protein JNM56_15695 [Planctomycetia bacterium]|nr:hypothetical protein [Planctomycetia bacterium]
MLRKVLGAVLVSVLCVGFSLAEELRGVISKIDGNKITFSERKSKDEKGPEQTLTVADKVKVVKAKFNKETKKLEAGEELEGGLKNEMFSKIGEKGLFATVVTDDDKKITEIRVFARPSKDK